MRDPEQGLTHEPEVTLWRRLEDELARINSTVGLERSARLVAVALVPVFFAVETVDRFVPLYTALIAYVLITSFAPRNRVLHAADLGVAAALVIATGGEVLPFLLFLMVAVGGPASQGGLLAGLAAGGTLSIVLITTLAATARLADLGISEMLPIGLLLPLAGVTVGAAAQAYTDQSVRGRRALHEANRLLSALRAIADDIPGGLDVTTVAAALVAEVRGLEGSKAVLVYALDDGVLKPVASSGPSPGTVPTLRVDQLRALTRPGRVRLRSLSSLPQELEGSCRDHRWWALAGMYREEELVGVLLVGVDDPDAARSARPQLLALAADGALALQNAQLFDGTRERAAQAARRHLAGDLHDGVAQALAHLRMELELLAMTGPEARGELGRLAAVSRTALEDLRATIAGLRSPGHEDLAEAIRRHIDFLTNPQGPRIDFECVGEARVGTVVGDEVLRVLQEALSNALRHADAGHIRVSLESDTELLRLLVEDDGQGVGAAPSDQRGGGIGIRSMQERAERLGGQLLIQEPAGGGTLVELRSPSPFREPRGPLAPRSQSRDPLPSAHVLPPSDGPEARSST